MKKASSTSASMAKKAAKSGKAARPGKGGKGSKPGKGGKGGKKSKRATRKMALNVKLLMTSSTMSVRLASNEPVLNIKKMVLKEHGVPPMLQRLMFGGRDLDDTASLKSEGVSARTTLHLSLAERPPSMLVVVVDATPAAWASPASDCTFPQFIASLLQFLNAFLVLNRHNRIAVIAAAGNDAHFVYSSADQAVTASREDACVAILSKLSAIFSEAAAKPARASAPDGNLAKCLSLGLCYYNRMSGAQPGLQARVLVATKSRDVGAQYVPIMNCIFSSQKAGVPIDACVMSSHDSNFLQQASHITGGVYLQPTATQRASLVQSLITYFLHVKDSTPFLKHPPQHVADLRASCFCHDRHVNLAYVCSVCLSVFCSMLPACLTCGTKRPQAATARRKRRPPPAAAAAPSAAASSAAATPSASPSPAKKARTSE